MADRPPTPPPAPATEDALRALRLQISAVKRYPNDAEARRKLLALAVELRAWDDLATWLDADARAATLPAVQAACLRVLVELHLHQGRAMEAETAFRRLRGVAPLELRDEMQLYGQLADLYETLLNQPFEAITMLERQIELAPDEAYLHERLASLAARCGAWDKAAAAHQRFASLIPDATRKADALNAAAELYRTHGQEERATELYAQLVAVRPGDDEAWAALEDLHERAGHFAALAEVHARRAELAREPITRARHLRGKARALGRGGDAAGAALAFEAAATLVADDLGSVREHAEALARAGRGRQAATLLESSLLDAEGRGDAADDIAPLRLELAQLYAGENDLPAAVAALEKRLREAPQDLSALALGVRLAAQSGDPRADAAARARRAAALPEGPERVLAWVDVAQRLHQQVRDFELATAAYEQVLELAPRHAEATAALAELRVLLALERAIVDAESLAREGQPGQAAAHIAEILAAHPDSPPARRAQLLHKEALWRVDAGELDLALSRLRQAHTLARQDLRITLSLGEVCFKNRLWREAALHLGGLASHADALAHAPAVAAGLVLAAQAETRALRPDKSEGLYEQAVKLDPGQTAAWHALAEIAMGKNDPARAAEALEKEAAATSSTKDRVRLYDALGDLAAQILADETRAERCYAAAAAAAPDDVRLLPLFGKLLVLLRKRKAGGERGELCERLAGFAPDRRAYLDEAIDAYLIGDDRPRAKAAAERLADLFPLDEDALWRASELEAAAGEHELVATRLGRALNAWESYGTAGGPRRAELWCRLGEARRQRGDTRGADLAFQKAVSAAPDSDAASSARRALVGLGKGENLPLLRSLVASDQQPDEVRQLARALAGAGEIGAARACHELADALESPRTEADEEFDRLHPPSVMASDQSYARPLDDADVAALISDPDDAPIGDLLAALWEAAALVVPDPRRALERANLGDAERVSPISPGAAAALFPQVNKALAGPMSLLYATRSTAAADLTVLTSSPPVVVLGGSLASRRAQSRSDADVIGDAELRFRLGRTIEMTRPRRVFAAEPEDFLALVDGIVGAFGGGAPTPTSERLKTAVPLRVRTKLQEILQRAGALDAQRHLEACRRAADRAGLVVCGHVGVALALCGGPRAAPHLIRLAASPAYLALRQGRT